MKCPKCGAENPEGSMFCQECGMVLQEQNTKAESNRTPWIICGIAIVAAIVMTIVAIAYIEKYDNERWSRWNLESRYLDKQYNFPFTIEEHRDNLRERIHDFGTNCPIMITKTEVCNADQYGNKISGWGAEISAKKTKYLTPRITYVSTANKQITIYTKFYAHGSLSTGSSSPSGYSFSDCIYIQKGQHTLELSGWGRETGGNWSSGDYRFEFWYNGKCIGVRQFSVK